MKSYLDTQGENVGETGQGLGRVQALERRVDHVVQCIDVSWEVAHRTSDCSDLDLEL